jgi:dCTP deaminase
MILTGKEIEKEVAAGRIEIDPFDPAKLNPNSYNVTLANELYTYAVDDYEGFIDAAEKNRLEEFVGGRTLDDDGVANGWFLEPGRLYLGRTVERTHTDYYAPMLEGRSSVGRLGVFIHITAGFGDVGFDGFWTLEISCVEPVIIYAGMEIGQIFFHEVRGERTLYGADGRAKYQKNVGVQASESYRDFLRVE